MEFQQSVADDLLEELTNANTGSEAPPLAVLSAMLLVLRDELPEHLIVEYDEAADDAAWSCLTLSEAGLAFVTAVSESGGPWTRQAERHTAQRRDADVNVRLRSLADVREVVLCGVHNLEADKQRSIVEVSGHWQVRFVDGETWDLPRDRRLSQRVEPLVDRLLDELRAQRLRD